MAVGIGSSSARVLTFSPIPITPAGPVGVSTRSTRMPATFCSSISTSLGHFTPAAKPRACSVRPTAYPVSSGSHGHCSAGTDGRTRTEKVSADRAGVSQVAVQPAASRGLVLGHDHQPFGLTGPSTLGDEHVGRRRFVDDLDPGPADGEQPLAVERWARGRLDGHGTTLAHEPLRRPAK